MLRERLNGIIGNPSAAENIAPGTWQWPASSTVNFTQVAPSSDVAPNNLTITPSPAFASASTNVVPASCIVALAAPISGSVEAAFQINRAGQLVAAIQAYPGSPSISGLWLVPNTTPSSSNYSIISNASTTFINGVSTLAFRVGNVGIGTVTASAFSLGVPLALTGQTITSSATAGGISTILVTEFVSCTVNGNSRKIALYAP